MGLEVKGKVLAIFDAKQITERFRKREFVVEMGDNPQYPQPVMFQLTGDRCDNLNFGVGDDVRVDFSLRGRKWKNQQGETRYFNSLDVWAVHRDAVTTHPTVDAVADSFGYGEASPKDDIPF